MISRLSQQVARIKRSLITRFKRRWIQDSREKIKKTSQGKYWKYFSKNKHSTVLFFKRVFLKFSKLPEFLLSCNQLPVSCNRLPVAKFDFKKFLTEFATFQLFFKWCNRLQYIGNRLLVYLNVEIQIQMWRVTSFHIKALCNRLHWFGNRLPMIVSE